MDLWLAAALVDLILDPRRTCAEPHGLAGSADRAGRTTPDRGWDGTGTPATTGSGARDGNETGAGSEEGDGEAGTDAPGSWRARPGRPVVATVITVTIPIDSLAGLTDSPGIINGFGVIPAEDARRLAAGDARWRHVLTCRTSGAILDVGTLSYRPPAALARHVRLRDGTCRFPGCAVPAAECDLDHLIPFPHGPTAASNLHVCAAATTPSSTRATGRSNPSPATPCAGSAPKAQPPPPTPTTTMPGSHDEGTRVGCDEPVGPSHPGDPGQHPLDQTPHVTPLG